MAEAKGAARRCPVGRSVRLLEMIAGAVVHGYPVNDAVLTGPFPDLGAGPGVGRDRRPLFPCMSAQALKSEVSVVP
jgi:hypothetical protein